MLKIIRTLSLILSFMVPMAHAAPAPAFTYQSMLNTYFDDKTGLISIRNIDLAFAPQQAINAAVALVDSKNTVIKTHKFYPDPRWRAGVFARLSEVGPADFNITQPGIYNLVFLIDGKPVSRLPVKLEQTSAGDDPFSPDKTFRYIGLWQIYAYLTTNREWKGKPFPELNLWVGGKDLASGQDKDMFNVVLKHKGKVLAHSKETQGFISNKHYQATGISLYHPHTKKQIPNAIPFDLSDWTKSDGEYTVEAYRKSDGAQIRSFSYMVKNHKIVPIKASELNYEPRIDYVVPRVTIKGASKYEFKEAIWLKNKPTK